MSAAVEQPEASPSPSPSPSYGLSCLPEEMVLNCFARVSRLDQAALSTVSKSYHSLAVSPEFNEMRSQMGCKEEYLYVVIDTPHEPNPRWFILRRGKGKPYANRLIPIPSFPTPRGASIVSLGWGIYVIGGMIGSVKTSLVSFLDCRTHTWSYVPSMRVARARAKAGVLDGKIYVFGGCEEDPSNWAEVFDPEIQTWSRVVIPDSVMKNKWEARRVYDRDTDFYKFPSVESMWNDLNDCKVNRMLFCCSPSGDIMWCEPWSGVRQGRMEWRKVYGLDDLQRFCRPASRNINITFSGEKADVWNCYMLNHGYKYGFSGLIPGVKLSNLGDNIVIFWDLVVGDDLQIWCAEISLERREGGRIWGTVQWSEAVLSIDPLPLLELFKVFYSVSVNV